MFSQLAPYYLMIVVGFIVARQTRLDQRLVARALIYFFTPSVIGFGILKTPLTTSHLVLPLLFFILCALISFASHFFLHNKISNEERAVLSYANGSGNTGYFGLPMTIAVLGPEYLGEAILCAFGFTFCENTVGYYFLSRGHFTPRKSIERLLKLPSFYAFNVSIALNYFGGFYLEPQSTAVQVLDGLRVIYSILGMMMLGFGMASIRGIKIDWFQTRFALATKFIIWPALVGLIIFLDSKFLQIFSMKQHAVMLLMSLVPYPANSIAFALDLKLPIKQISFILLLTTLGAFVLIPLVIGYLF